MSNQKWIETREEKTELNGEIISRKIISETNKPINKFLGIKTEAIEIVIKISGLILILIAVFEYLNKIETKNQEQVRQHYSDSIATAKYRTEQFNYSKEQQRLDNQLASQQNEIASNQLNFQRDLDFRRKSLEKNLTNSLEQIYLQKNFEIDKERREFYSSTLTGISINMEVVLFKSVNSAEFIKSKENLLFELYPKLKIIGDEELLKKFLDFKNNLLLFEILKDAISLSDTLRERAVEVWSKGKIAKLDSSNKLKIQIKDSIYYEEHITALLNNSLALIQKAIEIIPLINNFEDETQRLKIDKMVSIIDDSLGKKYFSYANTLTKYQIVLYNKIGSLNPELLAESYEELIKFLSTYENIESIDKNKNKLEYYSDELNQNMKDIKSEFDIVMNKKIDFYNKNNDDLRNGF